MRTVILILIITMLCCCKKKGNEFNDATNNLVNRWELRASVGGFAGTIIYEPGNGSIVEFKSDHSFINYEKGNIIRSGTYDLQTTSDKDQFKLTTITDTYNQSQNIILKKDTLVFLSPQSCCDMPDNTYVRLRK
ncbi:MULTISPECIES: hypothetical protein [Niastella]|uniref:Lipocalin-like domain-containing protein n=1 Tax=Niastella soli TaxID=2821487 RepID=A0ABS3YZZ3_9BACT|nr:hypothetical protein [Niastella soli]MBO9203504.1 hypothetical protein [Niastella soli]